MNIATLIKKMYETGTPIRRMGTGTLQIMAETPDGRHYLVSSVGASTGKDCIVLRLGNIPVEKVESEAEVMARLNLSDGDWESIPKAVRLKLRSE